MARYILNETSYFGVGIRSELATEIKARGFKKALLVSDKVLDSCGVLKKVKDVLDGANIAYDVFLDIKQNPTIKNCKDGLAKFNESGADFLIAVGGGSVMDVAKAIGITKNNPDFADVKSLEGVAATKNKSVPIMALPTTCGTAAEVTINYVIINEEENIVALVDAELMASMPNSLVAATGMDALTHAIEGYITKGAHTISDMFEYKAMQLISKHLRGAVKDKNMTDMDGMSIAQYVAGMGFSNVGLGIVHSMAHPLGAIFDIPHGVANAVLLPTVMEFNMPVCIDKYVDIAVAMGEKVDGLSKEEAAKLAVEAVRKLSKDVNIPANLRELKIKEEDLPRLAKDALADVCTGGNPRDVTLDDILALYKKAY